jgi:hypothetical protein
LKMFSKHVTKDLSAYCHGELDSKGTKQFAEHLLACARCRAEFEKIKLGVKLAEQLPRYSAPASIWHEFELLSVNRRETGPAKVISFRFWQPRLVAVAAGLLLAIALGAFLIVQNLQRPSWEVARLDGMPRIGSSRISNKGRLAVGQWLETDGSSRAQIEVGSIGLVQIDPNTRVRLLETRPTEHRLELAQGRMSARIWAPPRLFFVDTPSAVAADLGCAYTLEVNGEGASLLHVTSGWVALQLKDRESMVPAGAACQTRLGIGPGTPYFEDASESFRVSLAKFDFDPSAKAAALESVLSEARPRDSLTLWHLLSRANGTERLRVYERLAALAPPPGSVTREGALQLNPEMLQTWREALESSWYGQPPGAFGKTLKKAWTIGLDKLKGMEGKK